MYVCHHVANGIHLDINPLGYLDWEHKTQGLDILIKSFPLGYLIEQENAAVTDDGLLLRHRTMTFLFFSGSTHIHTQRKTVQTVWSSRAGLFYTQDYKRNLNVINRLMVILFIIFFTCFNLTWFLCIFVSVKNFFKTRYTFRKF